MAEKPKENVLFYTLIVLIVIVEATAIYLLEQGVNDNYKAVIGIILYTIVAVIFLQILKRGRLGIANSLWQAGAIIMISFISIVIIKEKMTVYEWVGLGLAVLAVIAISMSPSDDSVKKIS